ncbi:MAG: flagellar hook-associated protein FlgK [Pelosinus sp.]|jgi:flagellar hook-associated protein 1 FlgK|nr:flagellar hook-associated protein FlgK [Pelosinus sp.]
MMSSTFGGFNTVVRGLYAQQASLDTVGHNISNANTQGYSRQSVNLVTTSPENLYGLYGNNQKGSGVDVASVTRARDVFIDRQYWAETSTKGASQVSVDYLGRIEGVFQEPSDTGIQTTLDKFWSSLQTLSTNASDNGIRTTVRQRGVELADAIQTAAQQLTNMVTDVNSLIDIKVNKINELSSQISGLNRQIVNIEIGGTDHANDLRDTRDVLVDQLSQLININVREDADGNYAIQSGGIPIVSAAGYQKLATQSKNDPDYGYEIKNVVMQGETNPLVFSGGEIKGLLEMRDAVSSTTSSVNGIKGYLKNLETVSKFLLTEFNDVHKQGLGADNSTGYNFFGNEGTDYNAFTPATNTLGWISELKVNPVLFNTANGLDKIAAKTAINNITIQQSNGASGAAKVTSTYTATTPLTFQVRIATASAGDVNTIEVSTDNGANWSAATEVTPSTTPKTYTLPLPTGTPTTQSVTIQISSNTFNAVGDTYSFSVNQGNAAGNNAVNLSNRLKVDTSSANLGGASLDTYYSSVIGALGVQSQSAQKTTKNQETLINQIKNWRESVSGVSVDEEMTNMIRFQKGYSAAARMITAMDEMFDTLIKSTGVVGR